MPAVLSVAFTLIFCALQLADIHAVDIGGGVNLRSSVVANRRLSILLLLIAPATFPVAVAVTVAFLSVGRRVRLELVLWCLHQGLSVALAPDSVKLSLRRLAFP